ncbi:bifunctional salicylyl-CoA 5-hydroxylase/oxidoreductase [Nocardia farcinica]|uniref:bifunctional salicylyl-CoA 5-hydroxylase/oxidoreductase n=2 Tax=Nocardia farcinica TaxID=37329 RepID=UPI000BF4902E|nr:bifunctional salicylyl-CoA 5-hydroxylase/oxidoreductase [Nocardia farcinica]MBF6263604.1 bifunctional salicylyl-CoA 5-hydroxylase/oxidoreductase [Nocardia farcinica]MBF6282217.1 bifunctional salicylyl-CoA 5-hydroxylase/oxidoreductase [Nocardia farcinica]MBF6306369.1 bifunctional salicylyl-CoA 5-hydroxylase/oxidoreductase [Nocardia farcinica]MBF6392823.1 bifunctional salicylyl-CoA 5-hydroxylase/oxidoreductase [Nocardia farcinica]MBF6489425.1 bifunctional salicylyl-CoA 5-hydroxylase/oxidoredu
MRIAVIGGGPAGLYFSALMKQLDPSHEITIWERNAPDDTFGFGVVFSDETLGGIEHADEQIYRGMSEQFARWSDIDIHYRGQVRTSGGQGFAAMSRKELLRLLQRRCTDLGVTIHFRTPAPDVEDLAATHDLVLASDGINSAVRSTFADVFEPSLDPRHNKYMWLGTDLVFEAFEFFVKHTPHGIMQVHAYPFSAQQSTFIVEMHESVWREAGFAAFADREFAPGENDEQSIALIAELFAAELDGHRLQANNSRWISFTTVRNRTWRHGNIVLIGDAAHTAHFSIGSGTKLAMEDALALAACLHENDSVAAGLAAYETERKPVVESVQRAAQASLEWFESIAQYTDQHPDQFAFNLLTRSRRITYDNLRLRDDGFVEAIDGWYLSTQDAAAAAPRPPMFYPLRLKDVELPNRILVSPMDMYSAVDGVPTDFHLVHLGSKALGGAGLVMTEMVCVSPEGRITPGCAGLYTPEQERAWARVVDFVHGHTRAKIGVQLGHSGRKGATKVMWEGIDDPLESGGWETVGPSAIPYGPASRTPREITRAEMDRVTREFADAAAAAARAGFDLLELHCAHGYLLSAFLSPLANQRTDEYGGSLDNRLRFPLRVFDAIKQVWPADRPLSVRISATDWAEGGNTVDDAVEIARAFAAHGVDVLHVSSGQVVKHEKPAYGRSYQTPFADRIRQEVGVPHGVAVVAVGAISSHDDVNSVLLAGRADLVAIGRAHLWDPQWTLHAAVEQGYRGEAAEWPAPFRAGNRKPPTGRTDGPPPRLELIRATGTSAPRRRWTPARVTAAV